MPAAAVRSERFRNHFGVISLICRNESPFYLATLINRIPPPHQARKSNSYVRPYQALDNDSRLRRTPANKESPPNRIAARTRFYQRQTKYAVTRFTVPKLRNRTYNSCTPITCDGTGESGRTKYVLPTVLRKGFARPNYKLTPPSFCAILPRTTELKPICSRSVAHSCNRYFGSAFR